MKKGKPFAECILVLKFRGKQNKILIKNSIITIKKMSKKYDYLLFDVDNTLLDFDAAAKIAFYETLDVFKIPAHAQIYSTYKKVNHLVWTAYENKEITSTALRPKRFELFLKEINRTGEPAAMNETYLSLLVKHSSLWRGAKELLTQLQPDYKMVVITNGLKEVQRPRLALTKIDHFFEEIVVSDEIGVAKPQAAFFDYAFEKIQHPPKDKVLVIGDSLHSDMKGGANYGVDTCWFNPMGKDNLTNIEPNYEIKNLRELIGIL